ncbi:hypothetical protein WJX74_000384 [Apatococcus lobatus]|uniref:Uncharacterized protein n=1 Tax=Apatococcus lobatus TaxID=904363 RepID=A0AAW1RL23_9CHLO
MESFVICRRLPQPSTARYACEFGGLLETAAACWPAAVLTVGSAACQLEPSGSSSLQQSTSFGEAAIQGLEAWQHQTFADRALKKCCCTVAEVSPLCWTRLTASAAVCRGVSLRNKSSAGGYY